MARLEDILKADGWTDAELASSPLLQDARFRASLEKQYGALETQRDGYKGHVDQLNDWVEKTANPAIAKAEKDAMEARRDAARFREESQIARDYGYVDDDKIAEHRRSNPNPNPPANPAANPNDPNAPVNRQFMEDYGRTFAMGQRKAMAQYVDISNEHARLFGEPLPEGSFESLLGEMDNLPPYERGKIDLRGVWERKHNVPAKRSEIAAAKQKAHDDQIRAEAIRETESKYAMQRANPLLANPVNSRQPFIPSINRPGQDGRPAMPWDDAAGRSAAKSRRLENAMKTQLESVQ